jgi:hypothetical protein
MLLPCSRTSLSSLPRCAHHQGVPGSTLLAEIAARGDPTAVLASAMRAGRVRASLDAASVLVRLVCASRAGQLDAPAWAAAAGASGGGSVGAALRLPRYAGGPGLGARHLAEMRRRPAHGKTYGQVCWGGSGCVGCAVGPAHDSVLPRGVMGMGRQVRNNEFRSLKPNQGSPGGGPDSPPSHPTATRPADRPFTLTAHTRRPPLLGQARSADGGAVGGSNQRCSHQGRGAG